MKPDDRIMLAVFEAFLNHPEIILKQYDNSGKIDLIVLDKCLPFDDFPEVDRQIIRWHAAALLSEFTLSDTAAGCLFLPSIPTYGIPAIIDPALTANKTLPTENPAYRLNWSGQQLYQSLKHRLRKEQ